MVLETSGAALIYRAPVHRVLYRREISGSAASGAIASGRAGGRREVTVGSLKGFLIRFFRVPLNVAVNAWGWGDSAVCLIERDGKFLFIRNAIRPELWALPGGRIKKGERPEDAAARETEEEVGIGIKNPVFFGEQISRRGDRVISRTSCFYARVDTAEMKKGDGEVIEVRWFGESDFPEPLSLTTERALRLFRDFRKNKGGGLSTSEGVAKE